MRQQTQSLFGLLFCLIVQGTLAIQTGYLFFQEGSGDLTGAIGPIFGVVLMLSGLLAWVASYGVAHRTPWARRAALGAAILGVLLFGLASALWLVVSWFFGLVLALASLVSLMRPGTRQELAS